VIRTLVRNQQQNRKGGIKNNWTIELLW
jgi:hypothetical protein